GADAETRRDRAGPSESGGGDHLRKRPAASVSEGMGGGLHAETGLRLTLSPGGIPAWILGLDPLLSGLDFWTWRMTLILLGFRRFAAFWTRAGDQCHAASQ